jgi:hypothetical protein
MHQRGESTDQRSRCPHITLRFEEAPLMRLSVGTLRQVVKRDYRRLGLSRLQSSPSEGPQLLPAARPSRADRPHPARQEPPGAMCPTPSNRPHSSASSSTGVRTRLGRRLPLELRMGAAFFQPDMLQLLAGRAASMPSRSATGAGCRSSNSRWASTSNSDTSERCPLHSVGGRQ